MHSAQHKCNHKFRMYMGWRIRRLRFNFRTPFLPCAFRKTTLWRSLINSRQCQVDTVMSEKRRFLQWLSNLHSKVLPEKFIGDSTSEAGSRLGRQNSRDFAAEQERLFMQCERQPGPPLKASWKSLCQAGREGSLSCRAKSDSISQETVWATSHPCSHSAHSRDQQLGLSPLNYSLFPSLNSSREFWPITKTNCSLASTRAFFQGVVLRLLS